jgi:hypothetical protein
MKHLVLGLVLLGVSPAFALTPEQQAQETELDRVRAQVADEVHLVAFDLVDELVYGWVEEPVFAKPTPVVLAGVTVPVGLGSGMQALMENHIASVLIKNPSTNVQLAHCPSCTQVVVHSGPEATVVSRGIDNPEVLAELGATTGQYALFVDVEAEGSFLVLRARITKLTPDLPIVWSHTIATSSSTPAMLRESGNLKSAEEARKEYLAVLHDRGPILIPVRFGIRTYAYPDGGENVPPPPFLWVQTGVEVGATDAYAWTSSIMVGYSFIPQSYQGLMAQARVNRLLTGRARSHTRPDLYGFVGAAAMTVWGPGTASFTNDRLNTDQVILAEQTRLDPENPRDPRATFGTFQVGVDLRVGNRIGLSAFYETLPAYENARTMGDYIRPLGIFGFQSVGTEVTFWF